MLEIRIFIILFVIYFFGCTPTEKTKDIPVKKVNYLDLYPEMKEMLNGQLFDASGNSWTIIPFTDSTCKIEWGTEKFTRKTETDFHFHIARHFHSVWDNLKFKSIRAHTGSDSWFEIYLPLDSNKSEIIIDNPLARDREKSLIVSEGWGDTIVFITNLITREKKGIVEKEFKCESAFWHYCIDSVSLKNSELYLDLKSVDGKSKKLRKYKL
ncbi:MAG TPA: hypothetical protein PKZ75_14610 [Bacteroidia bacterium]|nr:hypothetical protein [Bacteroidia bacterium]